MRVIRRNGAFGTKIEVAGRGIDRPDIALARALDRPIGRGGGMRDPLPGKPRDRYNRDRYVNVAVPRKLKSRVRHEARQRGLSEAALCGMLIEAMLSIPADSLDEMLSAALLPLTSKDGQRA